MSHLDTYAGLLESGYLISERYKIEKPLGTGGMGSVYLAEDLILEDTKVAIKVLHKHLMQNEKLSKRFLREVKLMHSVNHPNVVRTYDFGMDKEHVYFTMEYIKGYSLNAHLQSVRKLPVVRSIALAVQICKGLEAIHKQDIVHRDLKPDNILILQNDQVKITDFGVARSKSSDLTMHDGILGTLSYIAPELLQKKVATSAADYYSLGVILYQMTTGRLPFEGDTAAAVIMMHINEDPVPPIELNPDLPPWLSRLVVALLAKSPDDRPKDLLSIITLMEAFLRKHEDELEPETYAVVDNLQSNKATNMISQFSIIAQTMMGIEQEATMFGWGNDDLTEKLFPAYALSQRTKLAVRLFFSTILVALYFAIQISGSDFYFNSRIADKWFNLRGAIEAPKDVVVVTMDEQSYLNLNVPLTSAWPRSLHTRLLDRLASYGAKKAVFDILFVDQGADPIVDLEFASAMERIPTILGASYSKASKNTLNSSYTLEEFLTPYKPFARAAKAIGLVSLPEDNGVIRRFNVYNEIDGYQIVSLAESAADMTMASPNRPKERDFINYYGPAGTIPTYSYDMVLEEQRPLPPEVFEGKTVFIGLALKSDSGPAQKESFLSPFREERIFGIEIHATAASNLIHNNWIKLNSSLQAIITCCAVGLIAIFLTLSIRPARALIITALPVLAWLVLSYKLFCLGIFIPGGVMFLVILPMVFFVHTLYQQFLRDISLLIYRRSQL